MSTTSPGLEKIKSLRYNSVNVRFSPINRNITLRFAGKKAPTTLLTRVAVDLILRNDDLARVGVIGVFDGVAEDADHADHLARLADAVGDVAGVTDELLTTSHLQRVVRK